MSTNGIYNQMQAWLNKHENNMSTYASTIKSLDAQYAEISKQLQSGLSGAELDEVSNKIDQLEIQGLKAELQYLEGQYNTGKKFNFMEGGYDPTNTQSFLQAYTVQTGKLAQGDMDAWEADGEDGISFDEYRNAQLSSDTTKGMTPDEFVQASQYTANAFTTIDINGDGIIQKNELQGFYAALDNSDGAVDGKLDINSSGADITSEKFRKNIEQFQQYL